MSLKARELIARMTLEEKSAYVSGRGFWFTKAIPRLGIPAFHITDGPHGLRTQKDAEAGTDYTKTIPATAFPTASLSACSFD
ncbi:MAG: glycosyl hydrolase, partial [Spirochaetota bacterium]